ncbi:MAG: rhomboid family intramembrane serine protease [Actinobacteria bacterium]|nr:rhomboid family intramembrane serine protease [Actinomycetota bacterium]
MAEARKSAPKVRSAMTAAAPVVTTILGINIAIFLGQQLVPGLTERLLMSPLAIENGQYWRLVTPMFLHGGIFHILMNSYVLYIFGPNVEQAFGSVRFALMYLAAGFMGNVLSFVIPPDNNSLGASGAIFGLAGILFVYLYRRRRSTFIMRYLRSISFFIVANVVLGFTLLAGIVDNFAHLGGLLGGIVLGLGFDRDDQMKAVTMALSMLAVVGGGVFLVLTRL